MLPFGQFVTFNLDPGQHILTANSWMITSPVGGGHLKINLVPGQHYYVGAYLESLVIASKFRLEQRTCQEAQQDNKTTKPSNGSILRNTASRELSPKPHFRSALQPRHSWKN